MFRSRTLFVVGAGASAEVGLPVGAELKSIIAKMVDIRFDDWGRRQAAGDSTVTDALREHARQNDPQRQDINPFLDVAWRIRDAMPQAMSIDNFLDTHLDPVMEIIGKLAIARSILAAERASKLFIKFPDQTSLKHDLLEGTWYSAFFQLLIENTRKSDIEKIFQNISFIVFNYDRCIEHFLVHAIQTYFFVSEEEAQNLVNKLDIFHPFGTVSPMPWADRSGVSFGANVNGARLLQMTSQIKTFTERVEEPAVLTAIRQRMESAETIVFLGFAFHVPNMTLIRPDKTSATKRVFATAFNISPSDCKTIEEDILETLQRKPQHIQMQLRNDLKCNALVNEYRRTLSR